MTRELKNVQESVYARLRNRADERGEQVPLVHQRYAAERLLYRLAQSSYRDRFVLRGGMLFEVWGGAVYRPTEDLDLLGYGSAEPDHVEECFHELSTLDVPDDGLRFQPDKMQIKKVREDAEYSGVQVKLALRLYKARIRLKVDVGFGDVIVPGPEEVDYPALLDSPAPHIRIYPRESVIAEKLHAANLFGDDNTRMKDFYDFFGLSRTFPFDGAILAQAIAATFERRGTALPSKLPLPVTFFEDDARTVRWRGYLEKNGLSGASTDFAEVGQVVREFLKPLYEALVTTGGFQGSWQPGGPWQ
jgi:predicted nucleotidyltransferase component of viral defense system